MKYNSDLILELLIDQILHQNLIKTIVPTFLHVKDIIVTR